MDAHAGTALRVVLDTNAWLDLLWFRDPCCAWLAAALGQGRVAAVTDAQCRDEWRRVLDYPQLRIDADARTRLLVEFDACAAMLELPACTATLPRCRDADDQKFLELAHGAGAAALFTRDRELLKLSARLRRAGMFAVLESAQAARFFASRDDT